MNWVLGALVSMHSRSTQEIKFFSEYVPKILTNFFLAASSIACIKVGSQACQFDLEFITIITPTFAASF